MATNAASQRNGQAPTAKATAPGFATNANAQAPKPGPIPNGPQQGRKPPHDPI